MRRVTNNRHEQGVVLVIALLLILAGTIIGTAAMTNSNIEMMISGNHKSLQQLFEAAEAGIDVGIHAFFTHSPPHGAARPPITHPPSIPPWGVEDTQNLAYGFEHSVWITDMQVSKRPPPGNDPRKFRTFYYRIRSIGREQSRGPDVPQGVKETDHVVGVVYKIR